MTKGTRNKEIKPGTIAATAQPIQVTSTPKVLSANPTHKGVAGHRCQEHHTE